MTESVGLCPLDNVFLFKTIRFGIFVVEKRYGKCPITDRINANSTHPRFKLHNSASSSHNDDLDKLSTISCSMSNDVDEFGGVLCKPHDCLSFCKKLTDYGCCVLKDVFSRPSLQAAQETCSKLTANLIKRYDRLEDEFNGTLKILTRFDK